MATTAKLFKNGRSQAVRLPREFRFDGDRAQSSPRRDALPVSEHLHLPLQRFAELDRLATEPFLPGRPPTAAYAAARHLR